MTRLTLIQIGEFERRFDGPIPFHHLETAADKQRRSAGLKDLLREMTRDHRKEMWRQLCLTKSAYQACLHDLAAHHRRKLDNAAKNLASLRSKPISETASG